MMTYKHSLFALLSLVACTEVDRYPPGHGSSEGSDDGAATESSASGGATTADAPTSGPTGDSGGDASSGETADTSAGSDPGDASSGADSSSGDPACVGTCVAVPEGWNGPVVAHAAELGDPAPTCDDSYAALVGQHLTDFSAPEPSCACSCGDAVGVGCSDVSLVQTSANCITLVGSQAIEPGCNDVTNVASGYWSLSTPEPQGGACTPMAVAEVPPAGFAGTVALCGAEAPAEGVCDGGQQCAPAAAGPLCVWAAGSLACPEGFTDKQLMYGGFDDDRGCSECTCGSPAGTCEMTGVTLFGSSNSCQFVQGSPTSALLPGECEHFAGTLYSVQFPQPPQPEVACAPAEVAATGGAQPTDAVTLCCEPS